MKPYQPEGIWEEATFGKKTYKQDHGDSLYRRTLYIFWRRIVGPTMFFACLTLGRLLGSAVLARLPPARFFRTTAILGLLGTLALVGHSLPLALVAVVACGLGFANVWPLVFSMTVERRPERSAELSGLMCMAIAGGAVAPLAMGKLLDQGIGSASYAVPAACFAYLVALGLRMAA